MPNPEIPSQPKTPRRPRYSLSGWTAAERQAHRRAQFAAAAAKRRQNKAAAGVHVVTIELSAEEWRQVCDLRDADKDSPEEFLKGALLQGAKFRANRMQGKVKPARALPTGWANVTKRARLKAAGAEGAPVGTAGAKMNTPN